MTPGTESSRLAKRWAMLAVALVSLCVAAGLSPAADESMPDADERLRKGDFEGASIELERQVAETDVRRNPDAYAAAAVRLAGCYQAVGHPGKGYALLRKADAGLSRGGRAAVPGRIAVLNALGEICLGEGRISESAAHLEAAEDAAAETRDKSALGRVLANTGNLHAARGNHQEALAAWRESLDLMREHPDYPRLRARILVNALRSAARHANLDAVTVATLQECFDQTEALPNSHGKAGLQLSFALLLWQLRDSSVAGNVPAETIEKLRYKALAGARANAAALNDDRLVSCADGYMGRLYEELGRREEALTLTRRAILELQRMNAPELSYMWQWQLGRLFAALGRNEEAIKAHEDALKTLQPIRQQFYKPFFGGVDLFAQQVKPVYTGLVDLFLKKAAAEQGEASQASLAKARDILETLKTVELEDLYQDECVTAFAASKAKLTTVAKGTAVLDPVPFPDRLTLLLTLPGGMRQVTVPVKAEEMGRKIRRMRQHVQLPGDERFREDATTLYDLIVRPVEAALTEAGVDTLVVAPYGSLCLLPFSALYDGSRFLVERFALVNVPGMSLTNTDPTSPDARAVLNGLSVSRMNFTPLPGVPGELSSVGAIMGAEILQDENFTLKRVGALLRENDYTIVHMATHGEFAGEPNDSFLVAYDGKLTMCELGAMLGHSAGRGRPIELLTLSACQTATGDERSAFGFGGLCIRAGVKSALATLWFVNDAAAREAMTQFYGQLKSGSVSKAHALRKAQQAMIADPRFEHPAHWAAFVLIGNWM